MLYLNVPVGDTLVIDDGRIVIHFSEKSGQEVKVGIDADKSIPVKVVPKEREHKKPWAKGLTVKGKTPRKRGASQHPPRAHEGSTDG